MADQSTKDDQRFSVDAATLLKQTFQYDVRSDQPGEVVTVATAANILQVDATGVHPESVEEGLLNMKGPSNPSIKNEVTSRERVPNPSPQHAGNELYLDRLAQAVSTATIMRAEIRSISADELRSFSSLDRYLEVVEVSINDANSNNGMALFCRGADDGGYVLVSSESELEAEFHTLLNAFEQASGGSSEHAVSKDWDDGQGFIEVVHFPNRYGQRSLATYPVVEQLLEGARIDLVRQIPGFRLASGALGLKAVSPTHSNIARTIEAVRASGYTLEIDRVLYRDIPLKAARESLSVYEVDCS